MSGVRLNKYIATSGLCSRRKADELIEEYESMQTFTELKNGNFEMITGNTYDEVGDWIRHKAII